MTSRQPGRAPRPRRPATAAAGSRTGAATGPPAGGTARRRPAARSDPVRRLAWDVLHAVTERGAYANLQLAALLAERGLSGRDAALATELVFGTLRWRGTYDAILRVCSDRPPDRIDPPVLDVLRLGAHQLLGMETRPHAAVSTSVDLARELIGARPAGFVNAVLRRVATAQLAAWLQVAAPDRAVDLPGHLGVRYSHPRWIVSGFAAALGEDETGGLAETEQALAADSARPAVTLCAVPGLATAADLLAAGADPARWSPIGGYLRRGDPAAFPLVASGAAAVQDEASQLAALALARVPLAGPDATWLDLCAGPGGKARLLAGVAAGRGARLVAAEVRPHRAQLVARALAPGGQPAVLVADGTSPAWRPGTFDRVIADVPCSGLGSLRRKPDAKWRRSPADVPELAALQRRLLAAALDSLRPGGVAAYVTCSPLIAETRDVVGEVLADRGDVRILDAPDLLSDVPGLRCPDPFGYFGQFWPHRHQTDAIFVALLARNPGGRSSRPAARTARQDPAPGISELRPAPGRGRR